MRQIRFLVTMLLMAAAGQAMQAQYYIVYSITGNVEVVKKGKAAPLELRQNLSKFDTLKIPFDGSCEILDASNNRKYELTVSGQGYLKDMIADKRNSVVELTQQYLSYMKTQIEGEGQSTTIRCSDPATIKRYSENADSLMTDSLR